MHNLIHEALEGAGCSSKTKRHLLKLAQSHARARTECCLVRVLIDYIPEKVWYT